MSWWQWIPLVILAAIVLIAPGYLLVRCWSVRGWTAVAVAAPVSMTLISSVAVIAEWVGWRWGVVPVACAVLLLCVLGIVVRLCAPRSWGLRIRRDWRGHFSWSRTLTHAGALVVPFALLTYAFCRMTTSPIAISQTYDNIFHSNAVRYILDSGSASSLTLGGLQSNGVHAAAYPACWHDIVSLVAQLGGGDVIAATNAVNLIVAALVWPLSCIYLATRVIGLSTLPVYVAGALSATCGAFPFLPLYFGVLFPYFLSLAVLPVVLGLFATVLRVSVHDAMPRLLVAALIVATLPGLALAHPSTLMAAFLFAIPMTLVAVVRAMRTGRPAWIWLPILGLLAHVGVLAIAWIKIRQSEAASAWRPFQSLSQALGQALSVGVVTQGPSWVLFVLILLAIGLVVRRAVSWWLLGSFGVAVVLFVIASAWPFGPLRSFVVGVWYNDPNRLAALLPVLAIPLAAVGAVWLLRGPMATMLRLGRRKLRVPVAIFGACVLGVAGQYSSVNFAAGEGQKVYALTDNSPVVTTAEYALLERVRTEVPQNDRVLGNPWTGTTFVYAVANRQSLPPTIGGAPEPEVQELMAGLGQVDRKPRICELVRKYRSYFVLDFPGIFVHNLVKDYPGLDNLAANKGLRKIDHQGPVSLYRVTACGTP